MINWKAAAKRLRRGLNATTEGACKTCGGKGWVSFQYDVGVMGQTPCPTCARPGEKDPT